MVKDNSVFLVVYPLTYYILLATDDAYWSLCAMLRSWNTRNEKQRILLCPREELAQ